MGATRALIAIVSCIASALTQAKLASAAEPRDLQSDTWVVTDGLGRSLPLAPAVGPPRPNRYVGVFYFLWLDHGGEGPFDITKILARDPAAINDPRSVLWGRELAPHHWGESIFGYYTSDDESILRKHAQMLTDACVDMIVFDVTNQVTYSQNWKALCRVFDQFKRAGNRMPKIAFLCPFGDPKKVVRDLWDDLYSQNLYPDLWFRWEGKPLILADPAMIGVDFEQGKRSSPVELVPGHTLGQTFTVDRPFNAVGGALPTWASPDSAATLSLYRRGPTCEQLASRRFTKVQDNAWLMLELDAVLPPGTYELEISDPKGTLGWWSDASDVFAQGQAIADGAAVAGVRTLRIRLHDGPNEKIRRFFTFRKPQPDYFKGPTGSGQWGWLEVYPQHAFFKTRGVPEEVAVGVAQNAADGKLSVFTNPRSHGRSFHDGNEPGTESRDTTGRNFAEQWRRALEIDPAFIFVTNWNEWIAGRFTPANMPLHGAGPVTFVDEFDAEFSRDIEPMKGGHRDNYYYQLVTNIRRYKGARPIPVVQSRPVAIDGRFDDWATVQPEYLDTIGDPVQRDHAGWGNAPRYVNRTGRNDIVSSKISFDDKNFYFYVKTRDKLTSSADPNWMLLFIDADQDSKTGWLGYDFVINRNVGQPTTTLEQNVGGAYVWGSPVKIPYRADGNELEISVPRVAFGIDALPSAIDFKWADNIQQTGDWSDFTVNGDAAPNDRFNYRAKLRSATP